MMCIVLYRGNTVEGISLLYGHYICPLNDYLCAQSYIILVGYANDNENTQKHLIITSSISVSKLAIGS